MSREVRASRERASALIEEYRGLVGKVASRRFPSRRGDDDLLQSGLIGLWEAAKTWSGKTPFEPFARTCIYHNMLDYVRAAGVRAGDAQELPEHLEAGGNDWELMGDADMLEQINSAWPAGSREHMILAELAHGADKRELAARMGLKTYQVTRIAKRAVRRVQGQK